MMSPKEAIAHIKAQQGDQDKWMLRARGYVDWKFGELAEFMGFEKARHYALAAMRWPDVSRFEGCLLFETYKAFAEAEAIN